MITGLKPYPTMKDSGVPWLGEVPEHWELVPNRAIVRRRKVLVGESHERYRLLSLTKQGIIVRDVVNLRGKFSADMGTSQEVRPGDLVFCLFDVPETPRTVGLSMHHGMITGAYTVFESLGRCSPRFFELFYIAMDDRKLLGPLYSGLRNTIPPPVFLSAKTPLPSPDEQTAIVRFLDHADRRIRRYIRAKQKLIKLLEEQKQAIIHRAVTRGLDPNVRLKPSGVEWLGDVPEHWEELPLKRVSRLDNSGNYGVEPEQGEEVLPVATTAQIDRDGRFDVARMPRRGFSRAEVGRYGCRPGDILVVKSSGSIFNVISGKAGIVRSDTPRFIFSNFLMRIVADPAAIEPEYLFLLLSGYLTRERVKRMVAGTTYPNLRVGEYMSALVPVPPISEQRSITSAVSMMTTAVDHAVRSARTEIDLLREYRTRLIADVVTGKLDVREAAARLPDEAEEPEPLDEIEAEGDADDAGVGDADEMIEEAET